MSIFRKEPAALIGLVEAIIALVVAFGVPLDAAQTAGVMGVVAVIGAILTRQSVYAPDTVEHLKYTATGEAEMEQAEMLRQARDV